MIFTNYFIPGDHTLVKFIKKQEHVITNTENSISNNESKDIEAMEAVFYFDELRMKYEQTNESKRRRY